MDQVLAIQSSTSDLLEADDSEELQLRVDSFRKLGYSSQEVRWALRKLGLATDTNTVLGELVRVRTSSPSASISSVDERRTAQKDPLLSSSWSLGSRMSPQQQRNTETELRPVVIDGSNVAMSHGNKEVFSCRGIQLAVNFFLDRGHSSITVFVPTWRKQQPRPDAPITDQHILRELEKRQIVVFTPSRRVGGKRVVCYDDRFIVKLAYESDGVIVSNDTYRDLQGERPEWKKCIEERLLMFSFVNDKFMPPDDPLGRHGPSLDNFLRKKPLPTETKRLSLCPYAKKCTYGIKCKFYHPERVNQSYLSLADELREKAQISTADEERNVQSSLRQLQSDPGPAHSSYDSNEAEPVRDSQSSSHPGHVCENKLQYWEDPRKSHVSRSGHSQTDWPGLQSSAPGHYYANVTHDYMDSGFGSFESHFSDHSHSNSHRLRSQAGHTQSCSCCSPSAAPSHQQQQHPHGNLDSHCQHSYPHMFPPNVAEQHNPPGALQYGSVPHHQQSYWSDPCQGLPQSRTTSSLPSHIPSSQSHNSFCSYNGHDYHPWAQQQQQQQQHQQPHQQQQQQAFDRQRMELRKKLYAIFNPHQVDTVMAMFPHLMDAEKLAAEILNMKSQRGIF